MLNRGKYSLYGKNHCVQFIDQLPGQEIIWAHPYKRPHNNGRDS